jgi:hypothetical protein
MIFSSTANLPRAAQTQELGQLMSEVMRAMQPEQQS